MASYFQSPSWVGNLISYGTQKMVSEYNVQIAEANRLSNEAINTARNQSNEDIAKSNRETNYEIAKLQAKNALEVAGINAASRMFNTYIPLVFPASRKDDTNSGNLNKPNGSAVSSSEKAEEAFDEAFPTLKSRTFKDVVTETFDKIKSSNVYTQLAPSLLTAGGIALSTATGLILSTL